VNLTPYLPYLPVAIGCLVGAGILTVVSFRRRPAGANDGLVPLTRSAQWRAAEQSYADRRLSVRREGPPVKVTLASSPFPSGTESGYVLDRSTGGLGLALGVPLPIGSTVQVRASHAPDTIPWVTVVIRSCRNTGEHYELGCEFDKTPPWNVLLLFG
jgi:hypothetical protein